MPNTFLIKDILNSSKNDSSSISSCNKDITSSSLLLQHSPQNLKRSLSPSSNLTKSPCVKKPKFGERDLNCFSLIDNLANTSTQTTSEQFQMNAETFMNSLIALAANQQYQNQHGNNIYSPTLNMNSSCDNNNSSDNLLYNGLYIRSSPSSSSSSSLSSTSPLSSSSSSSSSSSTSAPATILNQAHLNHDQLINQFYQKLLFMNLQNSLNKIQANSSNTINSSFKPKTPVKIDNKSYEIDAVDSSDDIDVSEYNEQSHDDDIKQHYSILNNNLRKSKTNFNNKKVSDNKIASKASSSSLKINELITNTTSSELDITNSDEHSIGEFNSSATDNSNNINSASANANNVSPLDALLQMANTTFINKNNQNTLLMGPTGAALGGTSQHQHQHQTHAVNDKCAKLVGQSTVTPNIGKRKRKNRTAFTAHQIYELEKRFSMQKYLSPSDRDRISQELQLSTSQVITWFQNRRAKQKRDVEEMKNDLLASKSLTSIDEQSSNCSYTNQSHHHLIQHQQRQLNKSQNDIDNDDICENISDCDASDDISLDSPSPSID